MATPIADGVVSIVDDNENVLGTKCVGRILVCRGVDCAGAPWGWNGFLQYGYMCIYLHIYVMYIYIYIYLYVYIYLYMCTYGYTHRECALDQMCGANSRLQEREQGRFTMCLYEANKYIYICTYMHIHIYIFINIFLIYVYMFIHKFTYIKKYVYVCSIYIWIHLDICKYVFIHRYL